MMIKKYVGVFLNLRVAVIYKKYSRKKKTPIKALKRLKQTQWSKKWRNDISYYPSRAYRLLTDIPSPRAFIACIWYASWRKMRRVGKQMGRSLYGICSICLPICYCVTLSLS